MPMTPKRISKTTTIALLVASLVLTPVPTLATCGGGGGGGVGGARVGGTSSGPTETQAYHVPWTVVGPSEVVPGGALAVFWFPSSASEAKGSDLLTSRTLSVLSARCVSMAIVTPDNASVRTKYEIPEVGSGAVLVDEKGDVLGRVTPGGEPISARPVEKLLESELDKREDAAKATLEAANAKIKEKDVDAATTMLNEIWAQHCVVPDVAKKAAKALKKLGHPVDVGALEKWDGRMPNLAPATTAEIVRTMNAGLAAERDGKIGEARRLYATASRIDPADATPIRFSGELQRHEIGDWTEARALFDRVLAMPSDPISRAVALHGLGKMTIHEGRYALGLGLFEESLEAFPLPLTYRNLAVYWNSEKDHQKAHAYVKRAIELDPDDEYNQIFAATYFVELGRPDEAKEIAKRYDAMLSASYNLAVIYAQLGEKDKALALLERHFTVYEKFDAVRAKEMQEARDDVAFDRLKSDPQFISMTAKADRDAAAAH
jgi:tetratricopeptide (TPR) repeat protein